MTTAVFAFLLMLVLIAAMAIGVIFGRRPISGSCGGIGQFGISSQCELCGGNPDRCEESRA